MKKLLVLIIAAAFTLNGIAQEGSGKISINDYKRAVGMMGDQLNKKVFNLYIAPNWFKDSTGFWYELAAPGTREFLQFSFEGKAAPEKSELFDHSRLAALLSDSLDTEVSADSLPLTGIEYLGKGKLKLSTAGKQFVLDLDNYSLSTPEKKPEENEFESVSPDKKWVAYTENYNLFIRSEETGESRQLSFAGKKNYEYGSWYGWYDKMEGENGERPKNFYVQWSEDSKWIYTRICDLRSANKMYLLDWSQDTLYRPRLLSYYRGSPGDTGMVYIEPVFFEVETGREVKPDLPRVTHINETGTSWSETPGKVYLFYKERGYQKEEVYTFDLVSGDLDLLYRETSKTNIDNSGYYLVEEKGLMLVLSEKSGWRQLYSIDLESKKEKALTDGEYYINGIDRIDKEKGRIYFRASGVDPGANPYLQRLYSISVSGKGKKDLTPEKLHHVISFSPGGRYFLDNYSDINTETVSELRDARNGSILEQLGTADISLLEGWKSPEVFTATARDGKTTIYGAIWKPVNFDPSKKYPVIDNSYTGPHTQVFPKAFWNGIWSQNIALAELGFLVVMIDGLGSSGRSKKFHDYSYKNLGGNLADHVGAIRQLGQKYPWVDTSRVGIMGHSAGGYDAAHGLLAFPGFYKVGVASSADHDHRMEKAWWPEMYMGWPVDSTYHLQSNITMAGNLEGKLLITHGGLDDNVNPSATFKLAEALIRNDKQFDMLILPSQRHGYSGDFGKYFTKMKWNYFVEHLMGAEPIWDFEWGE